MQSLTFENGKYKVWGFDARGRRRLLGSFKFENDAIRFMNGG